MSKEHTTQSEVLGLLNLLRPWNVASHAKIRMGAAHDGGYVLPDLARQSNLLFSIGIGDEISFDAEFAAQGAQVYQFDHTIDRPPFEHPNMHFYKKGWGFTPADDLLSFEQIIALADWSEVRHPVLKFDVEGAEWGGLYTMKAEHLARFSLVVGEFHNLEQIGYRANYEVLKGAFEKLCLNHVPVHIHVNNYQGVTLVHGVPVPCVVELSFMRKDCGVFAGHSTEPIPGPLDRPNNINAPEVCLRPI